jgi:hypothetical protein
MSPTDRSKTEKMGDALVEIALSRSDADALDLYISKQPDPKPDRRTLVTRFVVDRLVHEGLLPASRAHAGRSLHEGLKPEELSAENDD